MPSVVSIDVEITPRSLLQAERILAINQNTLLIVREGIEFHIRESIVHEGRCDRESVRQVWNCNIGTRKGET